VKRELCIGSRVINDESDCFIIAEIGHNHQGDLKKAKELFFTAKECGVDAVKLQKRDNKSLFTKALYDQPYDNENSFGLTYGLHREALEFGSAEYRELREYSNELGLFFFATAFDFRSADFLAELDVPAFKIASGDLKNTPLLAHIAGFRKPIFLSTGGGTMDDVKRAYDVITTKHEQVCILQCTAAYPAEPKDMNLSVITSYRETFPDAVVGLSDHQNGIAMVEVAYMLGARVIEKHFTLNHSWKGTDHAYSLEPIGLRKMVRDLRRVREALGDGIKRPLPCEEKPLFKMGKKLVAAMDIAAGTVLSEAHVAIKSPSDGLPPFELPNVLGRRPRIDLKTDDNISFEILEA